MRAPVHTNAVAALYELDSLQRQRQDHADRDDQPAAVGAARAINALLGRLDPDTARTALLLATTPELSAPIPYELADGSCE